MFEIEVLRRIFGPGGEEVVGGWGRLHEEFHDLYALQNIIRVIQSRRMRWAEHVAHMGDEKYIQYFGWKM